MGLKSILQNIKPLNDWYTKYKWRERRVSLGCENEDKIFYVVRRATCKVGLFSYVMTNMGQVMYALKKGYIPVIDMQSNENSYLEKEETGHYNAWEFYFKQPCGYTLADIQKSKNVILGNGIVNLQEEYPTGDIVRDNNKYQYWHKCFADYFHIKDEIEEEASRQFSEMFSGKRVLGVLCRGTDYVNNHPKNHPIQPSAEQVIEKAEQIMKEKNCEYLYLATEDEDIYQSFAKAFGEKLKVTDARRCKNTGNRNINEISYERERDRYQKGKEYLLNILILSKCHCLVAGEVGGTYGALLMTKGYEYQYVFDLGLYQ